MMHPLSHQSAPTALNQYQLFGRTGLRVSPLCLGTMTFGTVWGWGADEKTSANMLAAYADKGGNFLDTANNYTENESEQYLGRILKKRGDRDRFVLATKYTGNIRPGDPNTGGNHRKSLKHSVERSLKSMNTDYIDMLWVHQWEERTPMDEMMRALDDLVREGKVLYIAASDFPAWRVAQANTMADAQGWTPFSGIQIEYHLAQRTVEAEQMPMARAMNLAVLPWSPLGGGALTGKYSVEDLNALEEGTRGKVATVINDLNERAVRIGQEVKAVAEEMNVTPAQVAINWLLRQPGVTSVVIGAKRLEQLQDNMAALDITLSDETMKRLDEVSEPHPIFPQSFLMKDHVQNNHIAGQTTIEKRWD
jgi:aryl-alcohol dehydrogenase-like predicted oxidoreductase